MRRTDDHPTRCPPPAARYLFRVAIGGLIVAAVLLACDGVDVFGPVRSGLRRASIGLLGTMLAVYPAVFPTAVMGTAISGWLAWRAGRAGAGACRGRSRAGWPSRGSAVRSLLLCGSTVLGLGLAEASAAVWLAWIHRLPVMPGRFVAPARSGDAVSIVVIGGSSALGVPYEGWLSVGTIVGRELCRAIPDRRFRVEVLAEKGATLESMHQKFARLPYPPDVLIVYSGHNEFVTRFSWLHRAAYYDDELISSRHWDAIQRLASVSPLFRLVRENLENQRVGLIPTRMFGARETLVGRPVCTPEEAAAIVADFRRRLESIVADCERIGCLPILIIPPACDTWDPNQSHAAASTSRAQREALFRRMTAIRARETTDPAGALAAYREVLADQPTLAEAHYRLARRLESAGSFDEARAHYGLARDLDGLPMRCLTPMEDAYRDVARRWPRAVLVDGPAVLRSRSRHGILDDRLFHDNVHPTLAAHVALAEAVLSRLKADGALGWPGSIPAPSLDPGRCAAEFGLDADAWATVCERTGDQLNLIALVPYDPAERLRLRDRYSTAAIRIRTGTRPEDAGIPGLGPSSAGSGMISARKSPE
jgi:tetratricopeptide (TPR) repeat protein